jgi:hypothetical protein
MAGWRNAFELAIGEEDLATLETITRSRTEPASRVERARNCKFSALARRNDTASNPPGSVLRACFYGNSEETQPTARNNQDRASSCPGA